MSGHIPKEFLGPGGHFWKTSISTISDGPSWPNMVILLAAYRRRAARRGIDVAGENAAFKFADAFFFFFFLPDRVYEIKKTG